MDIKFIGFTTGGSSFGVSSDYPIGWIRTRYKREFGHADNSLFKLHEHICMVAPAISLSRRPVPVANRIVVPNTPEFANRFDCDGRIMQNVHGDVFFIQAGHHQAVSMDEHTMSLVYKILSHTLRTRQEEERRCIHITTSWATNSLSSWAFNVPYCVVEGT